MVRLSVLRLAVVVAGGLLILRLVDLQLVHGAQYRRRAEHNRLRVVPEPAPRGLILDRNGALLAGNHTVFRVAIVPQEFEDSETVWRRVSALVGVPMERLKRTWRLQRTLPFVPATITSYIPKSVALQLEEERLHLPGVLVRPETVRYYPLGDSMAQLLGYLGQPTPEELPILKAYGVRPQHLIGRMGLERSLDAYLRGRAGGAVVEVDHRTRRVQTVGYRRGEAGEPVVLTIDATLQSLIEEAFGDQPGAATVLDPRTGAVLAMVSIPAFAPAAFVSGTSDQVVQYLNDAKAPLMNRAAMGAYTPGSIAKLITASAALEHGLLDPSRTLVCRGALRIGKRSFHCWNRDGHGALTLIEAIRESCNVYFMQLGRWLGGERLTAAMARVGWGTRTGWELEERAGSLPERRLTEGEEAILALGQGEIVVTTLQAAVMVSAFANDGWLVSPWVVKSVGGRATARVRAQRLGWSPKTLETVRVGMRAAVEHPSGTAHRASRPGVSIAGKTGTAQTHLADRPHGWFVGFCPAEDPRIALAIVTEHGGSGGDLPADVGGTVCEYIGLTETRQQFVRDP